MISMLNFKVCPFQTLLVIVVLPVVRSKSCSPNAAEDESFENPVELRSTEEGGSVKMDCDICSQEATNSGSQSRWRKKSVYGEVSVVSRDTYSDESLNRFRIDSRHTLIIMNVRLSDMGYYFCYDPQAGDGASPEKEYLLDVIKSSPVAPIKGDKNDLETLYDRVYSKYNLTAHGVYQVPGKGSIDLRNYYVYVDFEDWGKCEACGEPSRRSRRGICRLFKKVQRSLDEKDANSTIAAVARLGVGCRSHMLDDLPDLQRKLMAIPDFIWVERCQVKCIEYVLKATNMYGGPTKKGFFWRIREKIRNKVRQKTSVIRKIKEQIKKKGGKLLEIIPTEKGDEAVLNEEQTEVIVREGRKITLVCPNQDKGKAVQWYHNSKPLTPGILAHMTQGRAFIDGFYAIQIRQVLKEDEGIYVCFVLSVPMGGIKLTGNLISPYGIFRVALLVFFIMFLIFLGIQYQDHVRLKRIRERAVAGGYFGYKLLQQDDPETGHLDGTQKPTAQVRESPNSQKASTSPGKRKARKMPGRPHRR